MVLSKDKFFETLKNRVGESTDEDTLRFIEDFTDTYNDLESKANGNSGGEDWEKKYHQLDEDWKKRYKERFFNAETTPDEVIEEQKKDVKDDGEPESFEDLFEEREG